MTPWEPLIIYSDPTSPSPPTTHTQTLSSSLPLSPRIPHTEDIDSELRLFAYDCVCYRKIKDSENTVKLQEDIDGLG